MKKKTEIQQAWADAVHNKDNMPYKHPKYGNKIQGNIRLEQHIVYNLARKLPMSRGTNIHGERFSDAATYIWRAIKYDNERMLNWLVAPFNGTYTTNDLKRDFEL